MVNIFNNNSSYSKENKKNFSVQERLEVLLEDVNEQYSDIQKFVDIYIDNHIHKQTQKEVKKNFQDVFDKIDTFSIETEYSKCIEFKAALAALIEDYCDVASAVYNENLTETLMSFYQNVTVLELLILQYMFKTKTRATVTNISDWKSK